MTWTLFPSDRPRRPAVHDHTDDAGIRWIGDRR